MQRIKSDAIHSDFPKVVCEHRSRVCERHSYRMAQLGGFQIQSSRLGFDSNRGRLLRCLIVRHLPWWSVDSLRWANNHANQLNIRCNMLHGIRYICMGKDSYFINSAWVPGDICCERIVGCLSTGRLTAGCVENPSTSKPKHIWRTIPVISYDWNDSWSWRQLGKVKIRFSINGLSGCTTNADILKHQNLFERSAQ